MNNRVENSVQFTHKLGIDPNDFNYVHRRSLPKRIDSD